MNTPKAVIVVDDFTERLLSALTSQEVEILQAAHLNESFYRVIDLREPESPKAYHKGPRNRWGKLK